VGGCPEENDEIFAKHDMFHGLITLPPPLKIQEPEHQSYTKYFSYSK